MTASITIIIQSPPFSCLTGKEGIDLGLVCATFEQKVNLVFNGQGIFHLLKTQEDSFFDNKNFDKQIAGLSFYDIEKVYAVSESLERYTISADNLIQDIICIDNKEFTKLSQQSQHTVIF
ncbi:DsrE family protein [Aliikangiella maris]|uniref:DsrE family protein n=2 Tax=Aliikangiella maris TaxID=3162458 RepID=A0ABV2BZ58_9GAMM